jgi:H+/gluconate symporter-like permease
MAGIQIAISLSIALGALIATSRYLKLNPFFSLLIAALIFGTLVGKSVLETVTTMQAGFGLLLQQIGFLVAIGSCLGIVMERTGAMTSIGTKIIHAFGKSKTLVAMSMIGVVVGIPVYLRFRFYHLVPVNTRPRLHRNKSSTTISCFVQRIIYFSRTGAPYSGSISCGRQFG